jgi:hypothetical protein
MSLLVLSYLRYRNFDFSPARARMPHNGTGSSKGTVKRVPLNEWRRSPLPIV